VSYALSATHFFSCADVFSHCCSDRIFFICRDCAFRSPRSRIAVAHEKRRGVKRKHDDDCERRQFFAGLMVADKENIMTARMLMNTANAHYRASKRPKLTLRTATRWKADCIADKENFVAGPRYSLEGNKRLTEGEVCFQICSLKLISCSLPQVKRAIDFVGANPLLGMKRASAALKGLGIDVSASWLSDLLQSEQTEQKLKPYVVQHKPAMTARHMFDRIAFCARHRNALWPLWVFTDEYTISVNGKGKLIYYARSRAEVPVIETTKYAPTFHLFAAITRDRTLPLRFFDGSLNSTSYTQILDHFLHDLARARRGVPCIFQHDGAPYHTSRQSQEFIANHPTVRSGVIRPLRDWPASSPDLNIIENLMAIVKREVDVRLVGLPKGTQRTEALYKHHLEEVWNNVSRGTLRGLYDSLPKRCQQCIEKRGAPLKY